MQVKRSGHTWPQFACETPLSVWGAVCVTRLCCLMRVCGVSHTLKSAAPVNVCSRAQLSPLSFSLSFPNSLWYHTLILTLSLNHSAKAAHTPSILAAQSKSQTHTQTKYNSFYRRDIGAGDKKEKERDTFYVSMTEVEQEEDERQVRSHLNIGTMTVTTLWA